MFKKIWKRLVRNKGLFYCSVCGSEKIKLFPLSEMYLKAYKKYGFNLSIDLFETLNITNYKCEKCGASDRSRLIALFISQYLLNRDVNEIKLLDIAPADNLKDFLKKLIIGNYRTADLFMEDVDDKVDLQKMEIYNDNKWDVIICSHVLEHIKDDQKAIKEIYRVLNKTGIAILLAPIHLKLDKSVETEKNRTYTEAERWKYFGQDDHERLYSKKDFVERIKKAGFILDELDINYFGERIFKKFGISKTSILYVAKKI